MNADTQIVCAPSMTLSIRSHDDIRFRLESGSTLRGNQFTLGILTAFAAPRSLQDGLEHLRQQYATAEQFTLLVSNIQMLHRAGFLKEAGTPKDFATEKNRFDAPPTHIRMLNDHARTSAYQAAIREMVGEGDVVLDIGTGSGVLAATAAQAGAKKVYAVERSSIAVLAEKVFEANGMAERIEVIRGHSTDIDLPEKADILVSEIIGNDPLGEGILSASSDAARRLLKPGARVIPSKLDVYAQPFAIPDEWLDKTVFTKRDIEKWKDQYGLDFSPLALACETQNHAARINTFLTRDWTPLSDPVLVKTIDFQGLEIPIANEIMSTQSVVAGQDGMINGILVYFSAQLSPSVALDIRPDRADAQNSWSSHVWIPGKPVQVCGGKTFDLVYRYTDDGSEFDIVSS